VSWETREGETGRQGDRETGRLGDRETGRLGDWERMVGRATANRASPTPIATCGLKSTLQANAASEIGSDPRLRRERSP
jgi:hypothetical protein